MKKKNREKNKDRKPVSNANCRFLTYTKGVCESKLISLTCAGSPGIFARRNNKKHIKIVCRLFLCVFLQKKNLFVIRLNLQTTLALWLLTKKKLKVVCCVHNMFYLKRFFDLILPAPYTQKLNETQILIEVNGKKFFLEI